MSSYLQHRDPSIFPSPSTFNPDRWLPTATNPIPVAPTGKPLSRYLTSFSKGPRMCLGINLAQAELFIGLAGVVQEGEDGVIRDGEGGCGDGGGLLCTVDCEK